MSEGKILSLASKIVQGVKPLPSNISQATGYQEGVYNVSNKTGAGERTETCEIEGCKQGAMIFECRVTAVIDYKGREIDINDLDREVALILNTANEKVHFCVKHIFQMIAANTEDGVL